MLDNLTKIKVELGYDASDTTEDVLLSMYLEEEELLLIGEMGLQTKPTDFLQFDIIVKQLVIARYNRRGNEGIDKQQVEAKVTSYSSDILSKYRPAISKYFQQKNAEYLRQKNSVRWF